MDELKVQRALVLADCDALAPSGGEQTVREASKLLGKDTVAGKAMRESFLKILRNASTEIMADLDSEREKAFSAALETYLDAQAPTLLGACGEASDSKVGKDVVVILDTQDRVGEDDEDEDEELDIPSGGVETCSNGVLESFVSAIEDEDLAARVRALPKAKIAAAISGHVDTLAKTCKGVYKDKLKSKAIRGSKKDDTKA